jgi:hypothetical protein
MCFRELREKGYIPVKSNLYIIITIVPLLSDTGITNWLYLAICMPLVDVAELETVID